jgi:uncharacterized protein (DUF849 family)
MVAQRSDSPHVPLTAEEIVDDGARCAAEGAAILHIHARRTDGTPAWERDAYAPVIAGLRERAPETIVCVTTSGRGGASADQRADVLRLEDDLRPELASLTLGSLNFRREASVNPPETIVRLAAEMRERGIRPELEIFDTGMAYLACELLERDVLEAPLIANLMLGGPNTAPATAQSLSALVAALPAGTIWAAGGIGVFQLAVNGLATFMGGSVRTGLEDNIWLDPGRSQLATNVALVRRTVELARVAGRRFAGPAELRERFSLPRPTDLAAAT